MGRPSGVTVIAVFCFLGGAFCLLGAIGMLAGGGMLAAFMNQQGQGSQMAGLIASIGAAIGIFFLMIAALDIAVGVGLLKLKEWARIVTIVLAAIGGCLGLLGLLSTFVHFDPVALAIRIATLAIQIWMIVYLLKPEVKAAFQGGRVMMATA